MERDKEIRNIEDLEQNLQLLRSGRLPMNRPFVTISYAQSIDGSIATKDRRPLKISGKSSMMMTHRLRSLFDAILVGIETVLADNPQLTVRLVPGPCPQPVVLDTHLRIPTGSRLLQRSDRKSWLAASQAYAGEKLDAIRQTGATILPCSLDGRGQIDLHQLMGLLHDKGINSLMVEGGAKVITSFILAELVDLFIITISPSLIGGLQVVDDHGAATLPRLFLDQLHYQRLDDDLILWAKPCWHHQ